MEKTQIPLSHLHEAVLAAQHIAAGEQQLAISIGLEIGPTMGMFPTEETTWP